MSAMPSPFQVRRDAQIAAQNIAHVAEARGYRKGYADAIRKCLRVALYAWVVCGWLIVVPLFLYRNFGG